MRGVARSRLIEIAQFYFDVLIAARDGAQVSHVGVAANPSRRPLGHAASLCRRKPFMEALRAPANVSVCVARHLEIASRVELCDT